ncbi:2-phospho-L-lactate guanylyltransferase [Demequina gelatinilytica]|uniref:2-phospho-L-lactate guanylyltransferase n=1 Tax=Demequina gelatinilytica TaxID=1638980 RepID=UPI000781BCEE|nr:2-phospho-L-lactate guanylyltransferase [Demequina gelatinilytica]
MTGWTAIVPVKGGARAKSRLPEQIGGVPRGVLAAAFSADTIAAVAATPGIDKVLVIAGVSELDEAWLGEACPRVRMLRQGSSAGLNAAVRHAATLVTGPVAVVLGDLPSLRPDDLAAVLADAQKRPRSMVGDVACHGTTMLMARDGRLAASFGPRSFTRHGRAGYVELDAPIRARADVDTVADLERAHRLGVGMRTAAALGLVSAA